MSASKYDNLKIGKIAQTHLKDALESGSVSDVEIKKMMESKGKKGDEKNHYSRLTFGLNFPLLAKDRSDFYDGKVYRYYSTPITIRGKQFYLCSQWFEGSRSKLVAWLDGLDGATKSEVPKALKASTPKSAQPKSKEKAPAKKSTKTKATQQDNNLQERAERGDADAQYMFGSQYLDDNDFKQALYWFDSAAAQGHERAIEIMNAFASAYTDRDDSEFNALLEAAERGDADAQFEVAECYHGENELDTAFQWYEKAAGQGHPGAQCGLGVYYATTFEDFGVPKNDEMAIYWFEQAKKQNNNFAITQLNKLAEKTASTADTKTKATPQDNSVQARAKRGNAAAQYELGTQYHDDGSEFDAILKDAESGDAVAQHLLAEIYFGESELEIEIEEDYEKAFYWYEKAAEQGHSGAQYTLAVFYATTFDDFGVPKDDRKALYWFDKAQKQDDKFAKLQLDRLLNKIASDVAAVPVQGADESEYSRFINNQQNIYPMVRPAFHTLAFPWIAELNILFGIDAGNMISLLNPDEIPPDITIDHVLNLACINLINNKGTYEINTYDNGIYWLRTPDDTAYAASFLLLYTFLEAALSEVGENIVFAVPTRQDVWFVGQSQKEKVVFMMLGAESQYDGAGKNAVSRVLLLYDMKTKQYRVFDPNTDL